MIVLFQVDNKNGESRFFEETFLLANISIDITFRMPFFILNNVEVNFNNQELRCRLYIATEAFFTTRQVELIEKKEFVAVTFDPKDKTFIISIASFTNFDNIHLFPRAPIAY